jgi:alkylation response protein AidB-like acyl-CoA dehydrogenase
VTENTIEHAQPLTVLAEDETIFRESVRAFAETEIRPLVREMDEHAKIPRALVDKLFELGVMGIEIPDAHGGAGGSFFHAVLAVEELSRVDPSIGVFVDVQNTLVINAVLRFGHEEIKRRWLPALASGTVGAYALSEAGSGSDAFALATRATEDGDAYVLSGRKLWITNGNEANLFIVFATVNPEAGYRGITAFLVERGMPGFSVGKKEDKLGIRASSTCELVYRNAQRRTDRHRRTDDWAGARRARACHRLHEGTQAIRQGHRRLPRCPVPDCARGHGD